MTPQADRGAPIPDRRLVANCPWRVARRATYPIFPIPADFPKRPGNTVTPPAPGASVFRHAFERVIEVTAEEAERFACNAVAVNGRSVVIERRARATGDRLRSLGYDVTDVDTGEFLKSGGSVYCMKNAFF